MTAGMDGGGGRATPAPPAGATLEADALALERRFQHVTAALTAAATPEEVMRVAVARAPAAFGAAAAVLGLLEPTADRLAVHAVDGAGAAALAGGPGTPVEEPHPLMDAVRIGEAVLLASPEAVAARYAGVDGMEPSPQALAAVPLIAGGRPFGAVLLAFAEPHAFTEHESHVLRRLAERTADAMARGGLLLAEQAARRRSDALREIAAALNAKSDARGVAHTLLGRIVPAVGAAVATVALLEDERFRPIATAVAGAAVRQRWTNHEMTLARKATAGGAAVSAPADGDEAATLVVTPLLADGRPLGVVAVTIPGRGPVARDVVDLLTTVGRMAGSALERAITHERDHHVADELQRSLLGRRTSPWPHLAAGAGYRPGTAGMRVGGDWHDIVPLPSGRLLLTVGDVVGSGLGAAAAMGQLRSALSALAQVVERPGQLLDHLSAFAESVEEARFATVCVATLDPGTGELRHASAGHPPPLVVHADGTSGYLWDGRSEPLASQEAGHPRREGLAVLAGGSSVLLYTDGLIERREEPIDVGLERLRDTVGLLIRDGTTDLAERALDTLLHERVRHDDAVVLTATVGPVPVRVLHYELPKDASALAAMREVVTTWLDELAIDGDVVQDLVLVLNEASANAIEHGEGGDEVPIHIRLAFDPDAGEFDGAVTGAGRWREQRPSDRGRGLPIIRNLTDSVVLERRHGTTLLFRRSLASPARPRLRTP